MTSNYTQYWRIHYGQQKLCQVGRNKLKARNFIDEHYPLELFGALTISLCQHTLYCTCKFHSLYAQQCANILRKNSYNVGFSQKLKG